MKKNIVALFWLAIVMGLLSTGAHAAPQNAEKIVIDAAAYPNAKCNDNTQATYYVRGAGANGAISGTKWLIFLHGGGSCASDEDCAERWYDRDGAPDGNTGFHANMTTTLDAEKNFNGEGILDFDGVDGLANPGSNPFAGFNRIMVPYCSSDTYTGSNTTSRSVNYTPYVGTTVILNGEPFPISNPGNVIPPLASIRFSGRLIVEAVIDLVMNGGIRSGIKPKNSTDDFVIPPASAADEIVISGSSAGGMGVIRNLDNIASIVHGYASAVKVFGIIDAADAVGVLPDSSITGEPDYATSLFYQALNPHEVDQSCQMRYPITASKLCFSGVFVLQNYLETPYFVVQQSFDSAAHGGLAAAFIGQLMQFLPQAKAESLAVQYIRNRISLGALALGAGVSNPQHVGYFIPNYETPKHQLMVEDEWFFNSPLMFSINGGNDPRLNSDTQSTLGLPRALGCFRFKISGQGSGCVNSGDAKVINTTYPSNPLAASFDAQSSTLTLPYVRLSNNTYFKNVVVSLAPLGVVVVGDPAVGGIGNLNEYILSNNVLKLPFVSVDGKIYERVSVSSPGIKVLSYEPGVL